DLRTADRPVLHEGRDAIERSRRRREGLQWSTEAALPIDHILTPQAAQQRVILDGEGDAVADVLAEPRVDRTRVAPAEHQIDPAVGGRLQKRGALGVLSRVLGV